ncbi:unnamed protein product, partial [Adineta steineri]
MLENGSEIQNSNETTRSMISRSVNNTNTRSRRRPLDNQTNGTIVEGAAAAASVNSDVQTNLSTDQTSITNETTLAQLTKQLPPGWEVRFDSQNLPYYVD